MFNFKEVSYQEYDLFIIWYKKYFKRSLKMKDKISTRYFIDRQSKEIIARQSSFGYKVNYKIEESFYDLFNEKHKSNFQIIEEGDYGKFIDWYKKYSHIRVLKEEEYNTFNAIIDKKSKEIVVTIDKSNKQTIKHIYVNKYWINLFNKEREEN